MKAGNHLNERVANQAQSFIEQAFDLKKKSVIVDLNVIFMVESLFGCK